MYNGIVIAGSTAVGKTALSIELAKKLDAVIISADSMQVYKKMNIGTSKITSYEMQGIKHYMLDVVEPDEHFDVGMYYDMVNDILKKEKKIPILVGGTGLYISAITDGLTKMPSVDKEYRKELNKKSKEELIEMLKGKIDLETIDINNPVILIRKLETIGIEHNNIKGNDKNFLKIFLERDRENLYDRINERVNKMVDEGLILEAKNIYDNYNIENIKAIGYKELFSYFNNEINLEYAISQIAKNSRRYAKRQLTWFRNKKDYVRYNLCEISEENIVDDITHIFKEGQL